MKVTEYKAELILALEYDENSPEFKEAFDSYKECIDKKANIDDMLKHVVWHLIKFGTDTMVEGVGYVSIDGKKQGDDEEWSGIDISCDDSEFDFEVERY